MVSIGRGRGRGWAEGVEGPLPRPGRSYSGNTNYTNLVNIINLANNENSLRNNEEISKLVLEAAKKEDLQGMHDELFKHVLKDREFGYKLLSIYTDPVIKNIRDSKNLNLHHYLVNYFQLNFEKREKLKEESITQFHNDIRLFSKFLNLVITPYSKFSVLQAALLVYMEMLLDTASLKDIQIFTEQIVVHGAHFYSSFKEKIEDLMISVRKVLLKEDLPFVSRQMLLYTIDLQGTSFTYLPTNLHKFYMSQFEKDKSCINLLRNEHCSSKDDVNNEH